MANNEDNLKGHGFDERTAEEQREIARAGGIASGEARRRKRTLKEIAEMLANKTIDVPMPDGSKETMTYDAAIIHSQYQKAVTKGDTKAAKFLATLLGEFVERHEVETNGIVFLPKEEIEGLDKLAQK